MATREENIKALADSLVKLSAGVTLSDAVDSELGVGQGTAATPKAVKTAYDYTTDVAQSVLEAAKNATEGSDNVTDLREPLLADVYHEIGTWWISLDNSIPVGGLPHLGHLCARDTYGEFWSWCETNKTVVSDEEWLAYAESHNGCCPYYSYGDGSTTFRTPKYDQSFLKVLASIGGTGEMQEAGLPDHDHIMHGKGTINGGSVGDVYISNDNKLWSMGNGGGYFGCTSSIDTELRTGDSSESNTIYGNSDTVTPQNFGIIVGVYAVSAVSAPVGETDAANLLNGLSTLESNVGALTNGSGFTEAGKAEIVGWGMPDYSAGVTFTSGFTAPKAGMSFLVTGRIEGATSSVYIDGVLVYTITQTSNGPDSDSAWVFVPQGATITVSGESFANATFYPLKGA